ncbi:MAG: aminoacyl--tRNA ligase-related protein, partial [Actinomycetota bacterium]
MIDVRLLRTEPDSVRAAMSRRGKPAILAEIDDAQRLDARLREITKLRDTNRAQINSISKDVAAMRRAKDDAGAEKLMAQSRELGETEKKLAVEFDEVGGSLHQVLLSVPNIPHAEVVNGNSDKDNRVVKGPLQMPSGFADHQRVPHWEIGAQLKILDNERAVKISGAMFTMQRGLGATMARALCQLALDRNADAYEEIRPPSLVLTSTLTATGQLPKFADDAFSIQRDDLWCIPTAEVPLTSLHAGETLKVEDLPLRYMAHTSCFRREAGAAGRDTRGMLRTH